MRLAIAITISLAWRSAAAEPSDRTLVYTGLALAPPMYLIGTAMHEGSHALAAKLSGAEVMSFHVFPPGRDPKGIWRFGWTYVRGLETKRQRIFFYAAPKITDVALLGGFAALVLTDAWPQNRYAEVALTVVGTGLWVDYAKDVIAFRTSNDVVKLFDQWCIRGWRQIPARLLYGATIVGLGLIVAHGYRRTFDDPADTALPRILPILGRTF